ncbi:MAG TPA: C39 family peptidase [Chloroflexota bacterium]|nr:C39 family peptidase [Chloroflexota bacterium]
MVRRLLPALALLGLTALPALAAAPAPGCQFVLGFAALHDADPADVGACTDNQAFAANGDSIQHTTRGMLAWRKADNWTAFTDGYQTWLNGPNGLVRRFNDEWFEWEAYPAETHGIPVDEDPPAPPSPTEVGLGPLIHTDQTMDNCGPAAIAEVLRYYGITKTQQELQSILRAGNPTGMTTSVIAPYIRSLGLRAAVQPNGTDAQLKALIRAGLPPIVEQTVSAADSQLHYRALEGYDDRLQQFVAADTLLGPRHVIGYGEFDHIWATAANELIVIYPPAKQAAVDAALR